MKPKNKVKENDVITKKEQKHLKKNTEIINKN